MAFRVMHLCSVNAAQLLLLIEINNFKPFAPADTKLTTMYALKNKVQLIGNLGNTPEVKPTVNGKKMARFSMATNETYRNASGDKITETQWHQLVAWGKTAEMVEKYLTKGKEVAIEGKLVNKKYTDANGQTRYVTEVQVSEFLITGNKAES